MMSCSTPVRSTGTPRPASRRVASRIVGVETVSGRRAGALRLLSPGRRGSRFAGGGNFPWRNSLKSQETRKLSTRPLSPATWPRTRRCIGLDCFARDDVVVGRRVRMDPFEPRRLAAWDAAAAAAVTRIAFAEQGAVTDPPSSALGETAEIVAVKLGSGGGAGLGYEGALIGVVLWTPEDDALYLGRLAVAPAWRGRGLAGRLIDAAETEARQRGFKLLRLRARLELPMNRRLFVRRGFVEVGVRAHPGYVRPTFAVMEKAMV